MSSTRKRRSLRTAHDGVHRRFDQWLGFYKPGDHLWQPVNMVVVVVIETGEGRFAQPAYHRVVHHEPSIVPSIVGHKGRCGPRVARVSYAPSIRWPGRAVNASELLGSGPGGRGLAAKGCSHRRSVIVVAFVMSASYETSI